MAHANSHREKREIQYNAHNRKAGIAKFKRNLNHRKRRRWDNRIRKTWVEERELGKPRSSTRHSRNDIREGTEGEVPPS